MNTRRYNPTTEEIDALFKYAPYLHDSIGSNNDYFYDDETTDEQRTIIFESSKAIYKSCLKIANASNLLPFC